MGKREPRNKNRLAILLAQMIDAAEAQAGKPQRSDLKGGMRIDVMLGIDSILRLQVSREKVEPSEKEWETTLKHLPEGLAESNVKRMEHQGRHFIRCDLA